jgi:hypothetical protein
VKYENVREFLAKKLKEEGFDGLCNPDVECGCSIDDIAPCGYVNLDECIPAYSWSCHECDPYKECFCPDSGCFSTDKPPENNLEKSQKDVD